MSKQIDNHQSAIENRFIEIVNWKKAQPTMRAGHNDWLKLYTSLLGHDGFAGLDDAARMLIVALWLYAASTGLYILPADPAWIKRKIPMLNSEPDFKPLLDAKDAYGNPTPFIRYCRHPAKSTTKKRKTDETTGTGVATRTRGAQRVRNRREEKREKRRDETLTGFGRIEKKERKERVLNAPRNNKPGRTEQAEEAEDRKETEAAEPEKPESPTDPEAGGADTGHIVPSPPRSAIRRAGPQHIASVIGSRFPEHWQDSDAEAFGWEIVKAIGLPDDRGNAMVRSEWGAFASWWCRVKKAAPSMILDELRAIAVGKADFVRRKAKKAKNRSAVWTHIMAGELNHRGVNITPPARASPGHRAAL